MIKICLSKKGRKLIDDKLVKERLKEITGLT